jgi:hypothetical protein
VNLHAKQDINYIDSQNVAIVNSHAKQDINYIDSQNVAIVNSLANTRYQLYHKISTISHPKLKFGPSLDTHPKLKFSLFYP